LNDASSSSFHQIMNEEHEEREDSYGCGINESFPCNSQVWADNNPLPFPRYESNMIYVGGGIDGVQCGSVDEPCSSLAHGVTHFDSSSSLSLLLVSSSLHNASFSSSRTLSLSSNHVSNKMTINIHSFSSSSSTIVNTASLTTERITFHSLYSSLGNSPFILSSSGSSLSLSSSSFSFLSDSSPSFSLLSVSSGSFSCSSVEIRPSSITSFSSSYSLLFT
jgi:hypothetical protein